MMASVVLDATRIKHDGSPSQHELLLAITVACVFSCCLRCHRFDEAGRVVSTGCGDVGKHQR